MAQKTNISDYRFSIFINNDQAKRSLLELEKVMMGYESELKALERENKKDTQEYKDKKAALDQVKIKMETLRKEAGLMSFSLKELRSLQSHLRNELSRSIPGSEQRKKLEAEYAAVSARIRQVDINAQKTGLTLGKLADGFNRYFAMGAAMVASLTGVIFSFRKLVDSSNEYEKTLDNLSALTGLMGDKLQWLSDQAKQLSVSQVEGSIRITQSADAIVDAYTKVGSARPELLANKEALNQVTTEAIILSEAANTELQPAVNALTMILNQFNAPAQESRRIINALAAGSKAGAGEIPYITSAIEKSGTVAADAGISIEELIATIETLAPRIVVPERAGRTLQAVILKLQEQTDDINPKIVGFTQAIENLGKKNLSVTELTRLFGLENITAAKILINNVQELKQYTQAVTDTNVAIEQATINTDNNTSKLEQARNKVKLLSITLGEKLAPAVTFSTNGFNYLMKAILASIEFFKEYRSIILSSLAAITAYTTVVYAAAAAKKVMTAATWLAEKATLAFNAALKANPWGLIIAGITMVVTLLALQRKRTDEVSQSQQRLNDLQKGYHDNIAKEKASLDILFDQLKKTNAGSKERQNIIDEINQRYGTTLKNLHDEKEFLLQIDSAYENIILSLERKALVEARQQPLTELQKQEDDLNRKFKALQENQSMYNEKTYASLLKMYADLFANIKKERQKILSFSPQEMEILSGGSPTGEPTTGTGNGSTQVEKIKTEYEKLNEQLKEYITLLEDQVISDPKQAKVTAAKIARLKKYKEALDETILSLQQQAEQEGKISPMPTNEYDTIPGSTSATPDQFSPISTSASQPSSEEQISYWAGKANQFLQYAEVVVNGLANIDQAMTAKENAQLARDAAANEQKKINLKKQLDSKLITQKQYDERVAALDADLAAKAKTLQIKQAKRQKELSLVQAIINTAQAVTSALSVQPFVVGLIMSILAGALGAVQIGLIASTPIPEAARGRYPVRQRSAGKYEMGRYDVLGKEDKKMYRGIPFVPEPATGIYGTPTLFAETGKEIIINPQHVRSLEMNYPYLIDAILNTRPERASGKYPERSPYSAETSKETVIIYQNDPQMTLLLERLTDHLDRGITTAVVYDDLREKMQRVEQIEADVSH